MCGCHQSCLYVSFECHIHHALHSWPFNENNCCTKRRNKNPLCCKKQWNFSQAFGFVAYILGVRRIRISKTGVRIWKKSGFFRISGSGYLFNLLNFIPIGIVASSVRISICFHHHLPITYYLLHNFAELGLHS